MYLIRRRLNLEESLDDPDLAPPENTAAFSNEDSVHESERLNWWMPEEQRHEAARHRNKSDDIPDMYEEGRKRLDDEEKHK